MVIILVISVIMMVSVKQRFAMQWAGALKNVCQKVRTVLMMMIVIRGNATFSRINTIM
jgi:hypothetical protein